MFQIGQKVHIDSSFGPMPATITQLEPLFALVKPDSGASEYRVRYNEILESSEFPANPLSRLITGTQGTLWVTIGEEVILGNFDLVKIKSFGTSTFVDEDGKYHLYSSVACKKPLDIPDEYFDSDEFPLCIEDVKKTGESPDFQEMTKQTEEANKNLVLSKTGSMRFNVGKPQLSELDPQFLLGMGRVLEKARLKYKRGNWALGNNYSVPYDSALRHLLAWQSGESLDSESGQNHLLHCALNIMMLHYYENNFPEMDDRIFKGKKYDNP
jgi:hypothetical protein